MNCVDADIFYLPMQVHRYVICCCHSQEPRLSAVGLQKAPDLPLPNLVHLNLSANGMTQIPFGSFAMMGSLRVLDLSNNAFAEVRFPVSSLPVCGFSSV